MQTAINILRQTAQQVHPGFEFIHGREFETAIGVIDSATVKDGYIFLDPVQKRPDRSEGLVRYNISIGFIQQDSSEGSVQEMEQIVSTMDAAADLFMRALSDLPVWALSNESRLPIYRVKHVCTGVLCEFEMVTRESC